MSCCNEERPFVYMILCRPETAQARSATDLANAAPEVVVDRTTMIAKTIDEVRQRALFAYAKNPGSEGVDPARLEVVVTPFCV